jgi:hypothetical protein
LAGKKNGEASGERGERRDSKEQVARAGAAALAQGADHLTIEILRGYPASRPLWEQAPSCTRFCKCSDYSSKLKLRTTWLSLRNIEILWKDAGAVSEG